MVVERRTARRLFLAFVILLVEFAVLEAAIRIHGGSDVSPAFRSLFMQDPRVGHRLRPGARAKYTTVEFSTDLAINAQGVRDDVDIGPKPPNERRVVVLGDSLVLSVQVPLAQTFCELLEARLNSTPRPGSGPASNVRWRVINGGVQGYGPVHEWRFFNHVIAPLEPDIVLIGAFVGNDAIEAHDTEPFLDLDRPAVIGNETPVNQLRRLVRSSVVLQLVRLRWDMLRSRLTSPAPERPLASYLSDPPVEVTHGLDVSRRAFGLIAKRAEAIGARTGIVLVPARFQLHDVDYRNLDEIVRRAGGTLVRQSATERFREALAPLALPTLDLLPVLQAQPDRTTVFFTRNIHFTPHGHRVVADALFEFLTSSGLAAHAARPARRSSASPSDGGR